MAKKKEVEVIDMGGAKTVARKTSFVKRIKTGFAIFSVVWIALVIWFPLHVKNQYSDSIKQSTVVSIFFDLQQNIAKQYEQMLNGIKKSINLEKPIAQVISKVKVAEGTVAKAEKTTAKAKNTTSTAKAISGIAGKFGVKTGDVDKAIDKADNAIVSADATTQLLNKKLSGIEKDLTRAAQTEVDKAIDDAIKGQLDSAGSMLLTKYDVKHVYPWQPSSWPTARKIYADLVKSDLSFVQTIIKTVNTYFGYVIWGLVIVAWAVGAYIWLFVHKKVKLMTAPFIVCPRCGHTFADKRTVVSILKVFQPWKWI